MLSPKVRGLFYACRLTLAQGMLRLCLLASLEVFLCSFIVIARYEETSTQSKVLAFASCTILLLLLFVFAALNCCSAERIDRWHVVLGGVSRDLNYASKFRYAPFVLYVIFLLRRATFAAMLVFMKTWPA